MNEGDDEEEAWFWGFYEGTPRVYTGTVSSLLQGIYCKGTFRVV